VWRNDCLRLYEIYRNSSRPVDEEARKIPKIRFLTEQDIRQFVGSQSLEKIIVAHKRTGKTTEIPASGAFISIGYVPNTSMLDGQIALNDRAEIVPDESMQTNVPGVFAAGDSRVKRYRQITTAVADGTIAALSATEYLRSHGQPRTAIHDVASLVRVRLVNAHDHVTLAPGVCSNELAAVEQCR
jgi:thioredoxin reductase